MVRWNAACGVCVGSGVSLGVGVKGVSVALGVRVGRGVCVGFCPGVVGGSGVTVCVSEGVPMYVGPGVGERGV